jgi:hypothetical protein
MSLKTAPVNWDVLYFPRGDMQAEPIAAKVTRSNPDGLLDLVIFRPGWRNFETLSGIRHREDPWLKNRPEYIVENGIWDFMPDFPYPLPTAPVRRDVKNA